MLYVPPNHTHHSSLLTQAYFIVDGIYQVVYMSASPNNKHGKQVFKKTSQHSSNISHVIHSYNAISRILILFTKFHLNDCDDSQNVDVL